MSTRAVHDAVEQTARESHGRLVAWLSTRCGDVALAEDAVADALAAALRTWPSRGIPDNPEAWLLTAARRRVIDDRRRASTRDRHEEAVALQADLLRREASEAAESAWRSQVPERRLDLMLVCTHEAIPARLRAPLILQTVLGLNAERIAAAMLVKPATLAQRLVRAKRRIRDEGLLFEVPPRSELPERIAPLLDAIYGAYTAGWEVAGSEGGAPTGLAAEALWLARVLVDLAPGLAEPYGLLALIAHCEARRQARRGPDGDFVPLEEQDPNRWDTRLIQLGEQAIRAAAPLGQPGPYQLEAAIQSLHAHRAVSGRTDWNGICSIYAVLVRQFPSLGAQIGHAAALGRIGDPTEGLRVLDALPEDKLARHQPAWAVRAWLSGEAGDVDGAREAYTRAVGLSSDPAVRQWLLARREELEDRR